MEPIPIILWCVPRSASTATERSFMQRSDTRCLHEMLGDPFYYSSTRPCKRYSDDVCKQSGNWDKTVEGVMLDFLDKDQVKEEGNGKGQVVEYVFIKEMAQYIFGSDVLHHLHPDSDIFDKTAPSPAPGLLSDGVENPTVIPTSLLRRFRHAFLIRTPSKSVPSYYKCVQEGAAGFEFFDAAETGYKELKILYDWMANPASTFNTGVEGDEAKSYPGSLQKQRMPPPLVDASVLLADPEHVIEQLCAALDMPFDAGMLSWESKKVEAFSKWDGYHKAAEESTGFRKEQPASDSAKKGDETKAPLPKEVEEAIAFNEETYEALLKKTTIRKKDA